MPPGAVGSGSSSRLTSARSIPDAPTAVVTLLELSALDESPAGSPSSTQALPAHSGAPASNGVLSGTLAVFVNGPTADSLTFTWIVTIVSSPTPRPVPREQVTLGEAKVHVNPFVAIADPST